MLGRLGLLLMLSITVMAAREYKTVFDCSSSDARYIAGRMALVEKTLEMIEAKGDRAVFAVTFHGGCVEALSRNEEHFTQNERTIMNTARRTIERLHEGYGIEMVACAMSLEANGLEEADILPFVRISPNSYIDTIGYQNDGYAIMTFP